MAGVLMPKKLVASRLASVMRFWFTMGSGMIPADAVAHDSATVAHAAACISAVASISASHPKNGTEDAIIDTAVIPVNVVPVIRAISPTKAVPAVRTISAKFVHTSAAVAHVSGPVPASHLPELTSGMYPPQASCIPVPFLQKTYLYILGS